MRPILLSPIRINSLELKNRVVLPPITMNFAENGAVSEKDIAYHLARAQGGCGLNMIDGVLVESNGYGFRLALDDDRFIPPLAGLADAIHDAGGKVGIQASSWSLRSSWPGIHKTAHSLHSSRFNS